MHKNFLWIGFLALIALVSVWFIGRGGLELLRYYRLSASAPAIIESWEVEQEGSSRYAVVARFTFKEHAGQAQVGGSFPNAWAAEKAREKYAQQSWTAWYNPANLASVTLEKYFPWKSLLSTIILIVLLLYFFCLGLYVGGRP